MKSLYDIHKTYLENAEEGPFFEGTLPIRSEINPQDWQRWLGFRIRSRIGVAAGPLLNSKWIALASKLGYDILTYKTIRSYEYLGHPLPNMLYVTVEGKRALTVQKPTRMEDLTVTNSFGMPSRSESYLRKDIRLAKDLLQEGQVLMVSVVGSQSENMSLMDDFLKATEIAKTSGADMVEANLSCPNVKGAPLYLDPKSVEEISLKLSTYLGSMPLVLKIGWLSDQDLLRKVLQAAHKGGAKGICAVNSIAMPVYHQDHFALSSDRRVSGICGAAIKDKAIQLIKQIHQIIKEDALDLSLLGVGGVTQSKDFEEFFEAGAEIAMTASGMLWDPYLAANYHKIKEHHYAI